MISLKDIPSCTYPMNKDLIDKHFDIKDSTPVDKILFDWVGSDCGSVITKYKCHPDLFVEFNSYHLEENETEHNYNQDHPNYQSLNKIIGNRNRNYILNNLTDYLDKIDYCFVYVLGGPMYCLMMKISNVNNVWKREYFTDSDHDENYWKNEFKRQEENWKKLIEKYKKKNV